MECSAGIKLGKKRISRASTDFYLIAEIGVNHEGDVDLAKKLIDLAKEGGADGAKFQAYKAEKISSRHSPAYWDLSKEKTSSQFELFKKYDRFGESEYKEIAFYCKKVEIDFLCTPFDEEAVDYLDPLVAFHKIASADLTNVPLLRQISSKKKPIVMSTGASTYAEIQTAIETIFANGCVELALLHCVLNYPTPRELAFLSRIPNLARLFPEHVIGYSDHTLPEDSCFPMQVAYLLGARVFEKHFTHDKALPGNDHYHAMDLHDLRSFKSKLENIKCLLGPASQLDFMKAQQMATVHARRSIVLRKDCIAGETLTKEAIIAKRPGHGISPSHWDEVIGKSLNRDLKSDHVLTWADIK